MTDGSTVSSLGDHLWGFRQVTTYGSNESNFRSHLVIPVGQQVRCNWSLTRCFCTDISEVNADVLQSNIVQTER